MQLKNSLKSSLLVSQICSGNEEKKKFKTSTVKLTLTYQNNLFHQSH